MGFSLEDLKGATVQYHEGGLMFAGESEEYPAGWYLFIYGIGAVEVNVDLTNLPDEL